MTVSAPGDAATTAERRAVVRVASVPTSHVYVRHLDPPDPSDLSSAVVRLPDPRPRGASTPPGAGWWPPAALEPGWVDANADRFDVFHVHFGFDAVDPADLRRTVAELRHHGRPLVYTVHDLRNPHHRERGAHDAHLDVLVPSADALITLTDGAADAVAARWGRRPHVVPHPHVVDLPTARRLQADPVRSDAEWRVGVHVKSVRPSMDPLPVLRTVVGELDALPGAVLQVNAHRDVLEADGARYDAELADTLRGWAGRGLVDLHVHDFLPDDQLWRYLSSLHASVLPYRFGTHSGWLEACRDLGTTVLAPDCGHYADQGPVVGFHHDEDGLDAASLVRALHLAHAAGPTPPVEVAARQAQRRSVAAFHESLYRSLLA